MWGRTCCVRAHVFTSHVWKSGPLTLVSFFGAGNTLIKAFGDLRLKSLPSNRIRNPPERTLISINACGRGSVHHHRHEPSLNYSFVLKSMAGHKLKCIFHPPWTPTGSPPDKWMFIRWKMHKNAAPECRSACKCSFASKCIQNAAVTSSVNKKPGNSIHSTSWCRIICIFLPFFRWGLISQLVSQKKYWLNALNKCILIKNKYILHF